MTMEEFKKRLATDDVVGIDVRGDEAYRQGHIPGAIMLPLEDVARKAADYKGSKKPIVVYCA
jgi:rhodanese-related sulfurtransferase